MTRNQLIIIGVGGFLVLVFILMAFGMLPGFQKAELTAIQANLKMWGVGRDIGQWSDALAEFKKTYPNIQMAYRGFDTQEDYESKLLEAFASGNSPDIFMVANESFPRFANKIIPFSASAISLAQVDQLFPQTVTQTFVQKEQVYALPLSIDTLVLIYNKDMLNAASIPFPPTTWEEFKNITPKLVKRDVKNKTSTSTVLIAASTLGGSEKNVKNASDILGTLMLQTGTKMVDPGFSGALFSSEEGRNALAFYTQFGDSTNSTYSWNDAMQYSIDAFSQEKVAMIFGYLSDVNAIRTKNSFLNFGVTAMPQPETLAKKFAVTHPFYYGLAVSIQTKQNDAAKKLILALTTNLTIANMYLGVMNTPPALLSLINQNLNDPVMSVFARSALIARSWPKPDDRTVRDIFSRMIDNAVSKKLSVYESAQQAVSEVNDIFRQKSL